MFKLYLDPGHGGSDTGATGNGMQEKNLTLDISLRIRDILENEYENVQVRMSRTTDTTRSLNERTDDANNWGADYFLSIHVNGFDGTAQGYEDYIHSSLSDTSQTARYRDIMHEEITRVNDLVNRGKKKANFHVLRETRMSALLTENGFIDHPEDAEKLRDPNWRQTVAQGHVNGLARAFNLQRKDPIYRVIVDGTQEGAYREQQNILNAVQRNLGSASRIVVEKV
ncbi:N-acetylmuramoyl-L-alanine amidase [Evansella vedderi]|uniref:N-acetylmuramoyl-L-alanine amidase n=1 Tax=Evansella vedderi TaxID=38282 RepID=A0ABT9ZR93_9BACI|nr:N-acetylmuramoyl-L-alanine amidase [Evansella vedderi]MDQ0253389.1 N-acetylmuramoyl-L-alanine amidase [Evansella vedderi]